MAISADSIEQAQQQFVEIMPDIERIAGRAFDRLNPADREEAVAETRAMAWKNHLHCQTVGKTPGASSMAYYAIKNVKGGRRFAGSSSVDVLSPQTQLQGRATVTYTGSAPAEMGDGPTAPLIDHRTWMRPFHRARVELDYPAFLDQAEVTDQEQVVFSMLAEGRLGKEIAEALEVSCPRVSQIKKSLARKMMQFFGRGVEPDYYALRD